MHDDMEKSIDHLLLLLLHALLLLLGLLRLGLVDRGGVDEGDLIPPLCKIEGQVERMIRTFFQKSLCLLSGIQALIASGTTIPVSVWFISMMTQITRVTAHIVPFNMWQYSV